MDRLSLNPEFLQSLILQLRAYMAQEGSMIPDPEADPWGDDAAVGELKLDDSPDDTVRTEIATRIEDLEPDQQSELVALMWIGRGDMEPAEWVEAVALAQERRKGPTSIYLLSHPQVADDLEDGVDRLYDGTDLMDTGEF